MPPDFVSSSFISSYPCFGPLSSIDSNASRISPGPKNLPQRPPRPQGKPPPTNGVAIPPLHQLPHLPYIVKSPQDRQSIVIRSIDEYIVRYIFVSIGGGTLNSPMPSG